jgi:GNAT superfamily N-acetyltransferase
MGITVRPLARPDVGAFHEMVRELAEFEKLTDIVTTTREQLEADAFASPPKLRARVAEVDGRLVGYAVYSFVYFSFTGAWLYLDDLYVRADARGTGVGKALLASVADDAITHEFFGMHWLVLDWNERAIRFYDAIGATLSRDWLVERVRTPADLRALADRLRMSTSS